MNFSPLKYGDFVSLKRKKEKRITLARFAIPLFFFSVSRLQVAKFGPEKNTQ
jgi:hypothetical protein